LFHPDCSFTDDTICTVAVADWLLQDVKRLDCEQLTKITRRWCRKYPNPVGGYGGNFGHWIWEETIGGYDSFGNGSAMRVSPVAWAFDKVIDIVDYAKLSAEISHDHPEGVKGARSISHAISMLRRGNNVEFTCMYVFKTFDYKFPGSCEFMRDTNKFDETCQVTVPQAFQCLLESTDFESAIRLAVSIGGDSDTIAAITGSLAEAAYGIPEEIERKALSYLPEEMIKVINEFKNTFNYGNELRTI